MSKIPGQVPKYKKLYNKIREQIMEGNYTPGDILPSESELIKKHNVTQPVVRQAMALLVTDGLIKKHQGKGSIVQSRPIGVGIVSIQGYDVTSHDNNPKISTKILQGPKTISWPSDLFIKPGKAEMQQKCFFLERIRSVNKDHVFFERIYIPSLLVPGITNEELKNKSLYSHLALEYGIIISRSEQKFMAIAADLKTATLLKVKAGKPIMRLERRMETNKSGLAIYSSLFAVTDHYILYSQS